MITQHTQGLFAITRSLSFSLSLAAKRPPGLALMALPKTRLLERKIHVHKHTSATFYTQHAHNALVVGAGVLIARRRVWPSTRRYSVSASSFSATSMSHELQERVFAQLNFCACNFYLWGNRLRAINLQTVCSTTYIA
jgi:hypothetical protein